jgi:hypothetical protein
MMSYANDTTRLSVASEISINKFEMGRFDWSSVKTQVFKLYNKFDMVTDCSFLKLPGGGHGTGTWLLTKSFTG